MRVWTCVIPGKPKQKGNAKRIVKFGQRMALVGDPRTVRAEQDAKAIAWMQRPHTPLSTNADPIALCVDVDFVFAIPRSRMKGKNAVRPGDPHTQRPDRGNLLKMAEDYLESIAYENDCVIADGRVRKIWGVVDETRIAVSTIEVGETSAPVPDAVISQAERGCSSSPPVSLPAPPVEGASGVGAATTGSRGSSV